VKEDMHSHLGGRQYHPTPSFGERDFRGFARWGPNPPRKQASVVAV